MIWLKRKLISIRFLKLLIPIRILAKKALWIVTRNRYFFIQFRTKKCKSGILQVVVVVLYFTAWRLPFTYSPLSLRTTSNSPRTSTFHTFSNISIIFTPPVPRTTGIYTVDETFRAKKSRRESRIELYV